MFSYTSKKKKAHHKQYMFIVLVSLLPANVLWKDDSSLPTPTLPAGGTLERKLKSLSLQLVTHIQCREEMYSHSSTLRYPMTLNEEIF